MSRGGRRRARDPATDVEELRAAWEETRRAVDSSSTADSIPARERVCAACVHPARNEIDLLLLNGVSYRDIVQRMRAKYPQFPLSLSILSRHRQRHLENQPIRVVETDPETGETIEGYITARVSKALSIPKEALPKETISLVDALQTIVVAGVRNIVLHPESVTPTVLVAALNLLRLLGSSVSETEAFLNAWSELGKKKTELRKRSRKVVTVEEMTEEVTHEPAGEVLEGALVVEPGESPEEEVRCLPETHAVSE